MKVVSRVEDVINPSIVERGSIICTAGADVTSQVLLRSLAADPVNFVTENGAVNPQGLNIAEHAVPYRISPLRNTGKNFSNTFTKARSIMSRRKHLENYP